MTKRYRETLDEVRLTEDVPRQQPCEFAWRGQRYRVLKVLGHWREDPGWWRRPDGEPVQIEQTDLWRVEARNGSSAARASTRIKQPTQGVYELVRRGETWRLDRVWD